MIPNPDEPRVRRLITVMWTIWAAELLVLVVMYLAPGRNAPPTSPLVNLIGFLPLFVSIILRWLAMPKSGAQPRGLLVLFVVGVALGEACGMLGIFLGGPYRQDLFILGILGVAQYAPLFVRRALGPKPEGFIPNH